MKSPVLIVFALSLSLVSLPALSQKKSEEQPQIRLAVSTLAEPSTNQPLISLTVDALKKEFGQENVKVTVYPLPKLEKAVRNGEADVFISSSGTFRRLADSGARSVGTIVSEKLSDPNKSEGSALIVKSARSDLIHLEDLKGKTIAANMRYGFSGHLMVLHEIFKKGFNPNKFFGETIFIGHDVEKIVQKVLDGKIDGGILRTCYWEEYAERNKIDKSLIRVIDPTKDSNLVCQHTSELFPNWTIATTPSASPEIARRVVKSILSVEPSDKNGLYWGLSTDFTQLDQLLKDLEIGPFEVKKKELVQTFLRHYQTEILVFLLLIMIGLFHHLRVRHLVRKRTEQLNFAHKQTRLIEAKYNKMQKVGIVGLLSSTVAHEIRQPLGAIQFFAKGMAGNLKKNEKPNVSHFISITEKIIDEAQKADKTIRKIRKLASEGQTLQKIDIKKEIERLLDEALVTSGLQRKAAGIEVKGQPRELLADRMCFDLVFSNILRNACEYISTITNPKLNIKIEFRENRVIVDILNNGAPVDLDLLQSSKLFSSKKQGFGFGLPIAIGLVENMGGKIDFKVPAEEGLQVTVTLPYGGKNG